MSKMNGREVALKILYQINEEGAYANLALDKALFSCNALDARDRSFITEIVYGSVKQRGQLDYILNQFAKVKVRKMDRWTRNILRMALYQIRHLDKVPDSAAVDEAVKLAKRYGRADKFVNAVLRNYLRGAADLRWPDRRRQSANYLAAVYSFPQWMAERFLTQFGLEQAEQLCQWFNQPSSLWVRTNTLKISRAALKTMLENQGLQVEESRYTPEGLRLSGAVQLHTLPAFQQGLCTVQDESSILVALAARPQPGQRVLDVCSAPGGKATHMAQLMQNQGEVLACDIHPHRLDLIRENCKRLGVTIVQPLLQDGTKMVERWRTPFDVVLCDVPCSGLGVLGRRPDARWSKQAEDIAALCEVQRQILDQAAQLVRPGGVLVYSTCTITPEENQQQLEAFLVAHPDFYLDTALPSYWPSVGKGAAGFVQFLPMIDDTDGFFIARLMRKEAV